ncbi:MAG: hypothetical protein WAK16_00645 [Candidatus Cybelea sp.]
MLKLTLQEGRLRYENGFNAAPWTVTRYHGERWAQVGPDLLCGIADVFPDVGIVTIGKSSVRENGSVKYCDIAATSEKCLRERWTPIDAIDRESKSVYSLSEEYGELYVPNCREAVEDVAAWTIFAPGEEEGYRSMAFLGNRVFRQRLCSQLWHVWSGDLAAFVGECCVEKVLFSMVWGPGSWTLFPGSLELGPLVRLADPVVARINMELTD